MPPDPDEAERRVADRLRAELARAVAGEVAPEAPPPPSPSVKSIAFNAAMARALIAGHKTQTRRPIKPLPATAIEHRGRPWPADAGGRPLACRLASAGDRLAVREPWRAGPRGTEFEADVGPAAAGRGGGWRPGRFMNAADARLFLIVTDVSPGRLADLSPPDAAAEGMPPGLFGGADAPEDAAVLWFRRLWDSIYGGGELAWERDPWVWSIHFRVEHKVKHKTARPRRAGGP